MPLFLDRHDISGVSAAAVAEAHQKDLSVQAKYGTRFMTYWCDEQRGTVFCLAEAPGREAVQHAHAEAHGLVPNQVIEVDSDAVMAFLGRTGDPAGAPEEPLSEPAFRAIMFTDMAESTNITQALGDEAAFGVLQQHHSIVREGLRAHQGREVDRAGDGFLASFVSVAQAVRCAVEIQRSFAEYNGRGPVTPIRVRIGLSAGEPVVEADRLFGTVINLGARICAHAQPEQILAAQVVSELCIGKRIPFAELGAVPLKGFPDPVRLYEVQWREGV